MIGNGSSSILHQEVLTFDGDQIRSMSTLSSLTNDMINPWQNN